MILAEMERLYALGFGTHWIKQNSKAPVKEGWSEPTRDPLKLLKKEYRAGFGLGVRLGGSSLLSDGFYLANIDVDIKSSKKHHKVEALEKLDELFPGLFEIAPCVKTGNGYRVFIKTSEPVTSRKLFVSDELTRVHLPTTEITGGQRAMVKKGLLTEAELNDGWRIRPAWELELMSTGKQGLVPPSIHPETGRRYLWDRVLKDCSDIPEIGPQELDLVPSTKNRDGRRVSGDGGQDQPFVPVKYDLGKLTDEQIAMIKSGDGVEDRSAACFTITLAMMRAGYSDEEILSALTDKNNFLAETAYDHRKTKSKQGAAKWVRKYCIAKARLEVSGANVFSNDPGDTPLLDSDEAVKEQTKKLAGRVSIKTQLEHSKSGKVLPSFSNTLIILEKAVGPIVARDEFRTNDYYQADTPWGWKKGRVCADDDDVILIKTWLTEKWGISPGVSMIHEIMTHLSLKNAFHPVKDELEALPDWDGKNRLDSWLTKYFGAKNPRHYVGDVFRKWMVANVMRVYEPGTKIDWMPVLEGDQGSGKSFFPRILAGDQYFADALPDLRNLQAAAMGIEGKRIIEFGELAALSKNDESLVKAFITRTSDYFRRPFGRKNLELPRQCVFIGTTDKKVYLTDMAGNRRYNPIQVGVLNFKQAYKDRDQLWAEALWLYNNGLDRDLYLQGDSLSYSRKIQNEKLIASDSSFMIEELLEFFDRVKKDEFNFERFRIKELFQCDSALAHWKEETPNFNNAGNALRELGATSSRSKTGMIWKISPRNIENYRAKYGFES